MSYEITHIETTDKVLLKRIIYSNVETSELDLSILSTEERIKFNGFLSDKRRREFVFTRVLLKSFNIPIEISYKSSGKPKINGGHISISHSQNVIIIGYSSIHELGVDIEFYKDKILRIKHKFLAASEIRMFDTNNIQTLTLIWSIKEAIYKMEDIAGLIFKEDIVVSSISERGSVSVKKNMEAHYYEFDFIQLDDYIISYCYLKK